MEMTLPFLSQFNRETGVITDVTPKIRYLDSLRGLFLDDTAFNHVLEINNPVIYRVSSVEPALGDGQLHYSLGMLMPGKIGREYFFTAGHIHTCRPAAELYIGLTGEGILLLQEESSGATQVQPLQPDLAVYVPGHTAHRTINCGDKPLVYLGVYPSRAGHDYSSITENNFNKVVLEVNGQPTVMDRKEAIEIIKKEK